MIHATRRRRRGPTVTDRVCRLACVCAYKVMRVYWRARRPTTHGALVALWHRGEILLVRNSYVPYYSLPGGYVRRGEEARAAALRELAEEIGIAASQADLKLVHDETHAWEGKHDHVQIFALTLAARPEVAVDHREVVEASWWSAEGALSLRLFPPLRRLLERPRGAGERPA